MKEFRYFTRKSCLKLKVFTKISQISVFFVNSEVLIRPRYVFFSNIYKFLSCGP